MPEFLGFAFIHATYTGTRIFGDGEVEIAAPIDMQVCLRQDAIRG